MWEKLKAYYVAIKMHDPYIFDFFLEGRWNELILNEALNYLKDDLITEIKDNIYSPEVIKMLIDEFKMLEKKVHSNEDKAIELFENARKEKLDEPKEFEEKVAELILFETSYKRRIRSIENFVENNKHKIRNDFYSEYFEIEKYRKKLQEIELLLNTKSSPWEWEGYVEHENILSNRLHYTRGYFEIVMYEDNQYKTKKWSVEIGSYNPNGKRNEEIYRIYSLDEYKSIGYFEHSLPFELQKMFFRTHRFQSENKAKLFADHWKDKLRIDLHEMLEKEKNFASKFTKENNNG